MILETEIAKSEAKEQVLASIMEATLCSYVPNPTSLVPRKSEEITPAPGVGLETMQLGTNGPLPVVVGCSTLNPEVPEWRQPPLITNEKERIAESDYSGASLSPSVEAFHEMLELHQHQNALQWQQNKIVEMLATQQTKNNLPQAKIPIFHRDPREYGLFVRAFENIIESKMTSESKRLYYSTAQK